jgi:hypothetical protein
MVDLAQQTAGFSASAEATWGRSVLTDVWLPDGIACDTFGGHIS